MAGIWFYEAIFLKVSLALHPRATIKKILGFHEWLLEALKNVAWYVSEFAKKKGGGGHGNLNLKLLCF